MPNIIETASPMSSPNTRLLGPGPKHSRLALSFGGVEITEDGVRLVRKPRR